MNDLATRQLSAIQAMLTSGHRNLRIERHTLVLWGVAGGGLLLVSNLLFTPQQITTVEMRAFAWLALLAAVLGATGLADWHLTGRVKRQRDETWSFVHRQILKVWWLLMAMGTLLTFATFFFGGGYMVCAAWMILLGVALYVHGLFSEELLEWVGVAAILIGAGSVAAGLDYEQMRRLAAAVSGLGLPLLAGMLDHGRRRPAWQRMGQTVVWILVVLGAPILVGLAEPRPDDGAVRTLPLGAITGQSAPEPIIAMLPPGTIVPVSLSVGGNLFEAGSPLVLPLRLKEPVQVLFRDGHPTAQFRIGDGPWATAPGGVWISIPALAARVEPAGTPSLSATLQIDRFPQRGF